MGRATDHRRGADLLADLAGLRAGDRYRLLPALAGAGAQVRAVAEQLAEHLAEARIDRPRCLVVIDPAGTGDGELAAALVAHPRVPVVVDAGLPPWASPLDLAVVLAGAPDDRAAAEATAQAARRGVTLIVRGAAYGPVAAVAGRALIAPRVPAPELAAGPGRLAMLVAIALAADVAAADDAPATIGRLLGEVADALDAEALMCGPSVEPFVNPALVLAQQLLDRGTLFVADGRAGRALADRCARSVRLLGGHVAAGQHVGGLVPGGQLTAALLRAAARGADLFADPDIDGPDSPEPAVVLVSSPVDGVVTDGLSALHRSVPRALTLAPDGTDLAAGRRAGSLAGPRTGSLAGSLSAAMTMALRVDFAAAYLGIAAGQVPPVDGPDGLGPSGGVRDARPATTVEGVTDASSTADASDTTGVDDPDNRRRHPWN